jgi:LPS-assembly protein
MALIGVCLLAGPASASPFKLPDMKGQLNKQSFKSSSHVTIQADQVSFSSTDNKAHATGNVVVNSKDQHLFCDTLDMDRTIQQVVAQGNIYLDTPQQQVIAVGLTYNFNDGTGEFRDAKVFLTPFQIKGQKITKVSEDYFVMKEGYLTTCDFDEPHFRFGAHRMDIYQHDRAVVHGLKVYLGKVPVMYLPYFVQDLKNRSIFTFIPGKNKNFGLFLLTSARFKAGPHASVVLHVDSRERTGFGEGFDIRYNTPNFGAGLLTAYYTDENYIAGHHLWDEYRNGVKVGPTTHHELYRVVWRHKWQIDPNTTAVWQYYKIHDYNLTQNYFLKNYFPREYQQNAQNTTLDTYFLFTHNMPHGTITFNVDTSRVNRPIRGVERLPEVQYTLNNQQIGKSGFYLKSVDTYSDLTDQNYPKTFNNKTQRFDSNDDINHPFKISFLQFNPHFGGEETYYSRTAIDRTDVVRSMLRTGLDMTTHFYKIWDYHTNFMGLDINRLRHVITPTISYLYQTAPTFSSSQLNQFDGIDSLSKVQQVQFGLENELQTKRAGQVVDLVRFLVSSTLTLKGTAGHRGFGPYDAQLDINPTSWLTLHNENVYDAFKNVVDSNDFDVEFHFNGGTVSIGSNYANGSGDQLTGELDYRINPKWAFKLYGSFPFIRAKDGNTSSARAYQYVITRDLHEWEADFAIEQQQGQGSTFYVLFRLKAFPDMKLPLINTMFHSSRPQQDQSGVTQ